MILLHLLIQFDFRRFSLTYMSRFVFKSGQFSQVSRTKKLTEQKKKLNIRENWLTKNMWQCRCRFLIHVSRFKIICQLTYNLMQVGKLIAEVCIMKIYKHLGDPLRVWHLRIKTEDIQSREVSDKFQFGFIDRHLNKIIWWFYI